MSQALSYVEQPRPLVRVWQTELTPYLKDSNAYGNIYFARYFEWQGVCREKWFSECICPNMFELKGALVTRNAYNDYVDSIVPFQKVRCVLTTRRIKSASFELIFHFYDADTNKLLSRGGQKIAMVEPGGRKLLKFPEEILNKVRYYASEEVH